MKRQSKTVAESGFCDLNLPCSDISIVELRDRLAFLSEYGYTIVGLSHVVQGRRLTDNDSPSCAFPAISPAPPDVRLLRRLSYHVDDPSQLYGIGAASTIAQAYDLIAVRPLSEAILQNVVRSSDVDIISLDLAERMTFPLKQTQIRTAVGRGIKFELCYSMALRDATGRRNFFTSAMNLIRVIGVSNIILSSEAKRALELRPPADVANLASLLGFKDISPALNSLGQNARDAVCHGAIRRDPLHGRIQLLQTLDPQTDRSHPQAVAVPAAIKAGPNVSAGEASNTIKASPPPSPTNPPSPSPTNPPSPSTTEALSDTRGSMEDSAGMDVDVDVVSVCSVASNGAQSHTSLNSGNRTPGSPANEPIEVDEAPLSGNSDAALPNTPEIVEVSVDDSNQDSEVCISGDSKSGVVAKVEDADTASPADELVPSLSAGAGSPHPNTHELATTEEATVSAPNTHVDNFNLTRKRPRSPPSTESNAPVTSGDPASNVDEFLSLEPPLKKVAGEPSTTEPGLRPAPVSRTGRPVSSVMARLLARSNSTTEVTLPSASSSVIGNPTAVKTPDPHSHTFDTLESVDPVDKREMDFLPLTTEEPELEFEPEHKTKLPVDPSSSPPSKKKKKKKKKKSASALIAGLNLPVQDAPARPASSATQPAVSSKSKGEKPSSLHKSRGTMDSKSGRPVNTPSTSSAANILSLLSAGCVPPTGSAPLTKTISKKKSKNKKKLLKPLNSEPV